ncbi:MAG: hypothetical protein KDJ29_04235 [Hyphomicrobiales bacterium]|nr:hypothetical protein [Hyphomicrobiales bacterium]
MTFRTRISAFAIASAIGLGALAMPAQAGGYTGLGVYTDASPSRYASEGLAGAPLAAERYRSTVSFHHYRSRRDHVRFNIRAAKRSAVYERIDRAHRAW